MHHGIETGDGAKARDELADFMAGLDAQAARFVEQRDRLRARQAVRTTRATEVPSA